MHVLEAAHIANFMKSPRHELFGYPPAERREIRLLLDAALEVPAAPSAPSLVSRLAARLRHLLGRQRAGAADIASPI